ncbi:MAG: thioredoxin [Microbacterium sp.]|jgi:thiol-disulfide isomerase/thioredoxin|uniref:Thioredoxin n=1 Tax=Microbacterium ginsengisoli TaxID=400772 RepID=A0A0F0LSW6_9MICO|nr:MULTISPECIES: thioredoxin family protein [Microbacterium]MAL05935.1 thioredoxin [Microbacterium sp.]MCK9917527.1 thioredoxin family protein [Microbacteriaceae bacterium K1510]KJL36327.1 Thioredoxin [Microbacterium ginsengisoli]KQR92291.1 thiol-disulfide isomerase [Microbacterium sp. Leaf351]KQR92814.1 thiol-disulfide isomerase [Microbacterium sp. Leaf347]
MDPIIVALVLVGLVAVASVFGVLSKRSLGRSTRIESGDVVNPQRLGFDELGEQATLVQFSTEFCARCPGVHRALGEIAGAHPGVRHVDIDLTHRPDIAKRFSVLQTPTTLILDGSGRVRTRFTGAAPRTAVELELTRLQKENTRV